MRTVFEIAQSLQNKIESDLTAPYRMKEVIRESFLNDDAMPKIMTQNRLDTLNNRFDIADRSNTFADELGYNQAAMQEQRLTAENNLATLGERQEAESVKRQIELEKDRYTLSTLGKQKELWAEKLDAEIAQEKSSIVESENVIETRMHDDEFKAIMDKYPDIDGLPPPQRVEILLNEISNKSTGVKKRVKLHLRDTVAKPYLETLALMEQASIETQSLGPNSTESQRLVARRLQRQVQSALQKFDVATFYELLNNGVIYQEEVSANAEGMIEQFQGLQIEQQEGIPSDVAPADPAVASAPTEVPAPTETPPVPSDVPVDVPTDLPAEVDDYSSLSTDTSVETLTRYLSANHEIANPQFVLTMGSIFDIDLNTQPTTPEQANEMAEALISRSSVLSNSFSKLSPEFQETLTDMVVGRIIQLQSFSSN